MKNMFINIGNGIIINKQHIVSIYVNMEKQTEIVITMIDGKEHVLTFQAECGRKVFIEEYIDPFPKHRFQVV